MMLKTNQTGFGTALKAQTFRISSEWDSEKTPPIKLHKASKT
jgi:hypothetical protein